MAATRPPVRITDPRTIRALAHPARLAVIEELYAGRALTATECAAVAGLTPSAMSYHLRSLEKVGIVERAESTGDGRERPWRAAGSSLRVESESDVAEGATFATLMLSRLGDQFADWQERRHNESREWQDASIFSSASVWMTVDELVAFGELVHGKIEEYRAGNDRPDNARRVRISLFALPTADRDRPEKKEDSAS